MLGKYLLATVSGLVVFVLSSLVVAVVLGFLLPPQVWHYRANIGPVGANVPSLIACVAGAGAATSTFWASLHAKTGRLYRKGRQTSIDS